MKLYSLLDVIIGLICIICLVVTQLQSATTEVSLLLQGQVSTARMSKRGITSSVTPSSTLFSTYGYLRTSLQTSLPVWACLRKLSSRQLLVVLEAPQGTLQQCLQPSLQIYCLHNQQNCLACNFNPNPIEQVTIFLQDHENIKASRKRKHHH